MFENLFAFIIFCSVILFMADRLETILEKRKNKRVFPNFVFSPPVFVEEKIRKRRWSFPYPISRRF